MYNKEYYDGKKKRVEDKYGALKDRTLNTIFSAVDLFTQEQKEINKDLEEILQLEMDSKAQERLVENKDKKKVKKSLETVEAEAQPENQP